MNLSNAILQFYVSFKAFVTYLNIIGIAPRLGVSPDALTGLNDIKTDVDSKYTIYITPDLNNSGSISDMNASYKDALLYVDGIKKTMKANTIIALTGKDRLNLGIPADKPRRSHVGIYNVAPAVLCIEQFHLRMNFIAFDPTNPFRRAKHLDVSSIGVRIAITAVGAPAPKPEEYQNLTPEKQTEFEMLFTTDQLGKTIYIICYYLNFRNEAGPDSIPYSITII